MQFKPTTHAAMLLNSLSQLGAAANVQQHEAKVPGKRMTSLNMEQQREVYEAAEAKRVRKQHRNLINAGKQVPLTDF